MSFSGSGGKQNQRTSTSAKMTSSNNNSSSAGKGNRNRGGGNGGSPSAAGGKAVVAGEGVWANSRFFHAVTSLVGVTVKVETQNGNLYEGVLKTFSPEFELALVQSHLIDPKNPDVINPNSVQETHIFRIGDIVRCYATDVDLDFASKDGFQTDAQISHHKNGEAAMRDLEEWKPDEGDDGAALELESSANGWSAVDMFSRNEKNHGIITTYKENLEGYTVQLTNENKEYAARAEEMARQIEGSKNNANNIECENGDENEEERFSAVQRPISNGPSSRNVRESGSVDNGKYVPPPIRNNSNKSTPPPRGGGATPHRHHRDDYRTSGGRGRGGGYNSPRGDYNNDKQRNYNSRYATNNKMPSVSAKDPEKSPPNSAVRKRDKNRGGDINDLKEFSENFSLAATDNNNKSISPSPSTIVGAQAEGSDHHSITVTAASSPMTVSAVDSPRSVSTTVASTPGGQQSKKFNLNPSAEEFVLNPNAKTFTPTRPNVTGTPPRPQTPATPSGHPQGPAAAAYQQQGIAHQYPPAQFQPTFVHNTNAQQRFTRPPREFSRNDIPPSSMQVAGTPIMPAGGIPASYFQAGAPTSHPGMMMRMPAMGLQTSIMNTTGNLAIAQAAAAQAAAEQQQQQQQQPHSGPPGLQQTPQQAHPPPPQGQQWHGIPQHQPPPQQGNPPPANGSHPPPPHMSGGTPPAQNQQAPSPGPPNLFFNGGIMMHPHQQAAVQAAAGNANGNQQPMGFPPQIMFLHQPSQMIQQPLIPISTAPGILPIYGAHHPVPGHHNSHGMMPPQQQWAAGSNDQDQSSGYHQQYYHHPQQIDEYYQHQQHDNMNYNPA